MTRCLDFSLPLVQKKTDTPHSKSFKALVKATDFQYAASY